MVKFEGYEFVDGGVCAAEGFTAAGVIAGIKAGNTTKRDLAMIFCAERCKAAALYTTNKVKGAPIYVTKSTSRTAVHRRLSLTPATPTPATKTALRSPNRCASSPQKRLISTLTMFS